MKKKGIFTIATSNHPERINDAILNRPSRFDVKYTFALSTQELHKTYIGKWNEEVKRSSGIDFSETLVAEMVEKTEGFSFAWINFRFVSLLLRIAAGGETIDPEEAMRSQLKQLSKQIEMGEGEGGDEGGFSDGPPAACPHWKRGGRS
ncbi:hypothetical protein M422DRAFT_36218 [Sphaerobolus stellatus SS14]|uniref:ATPase AAA-type core domain-containing protein n=1 Tax=Sphaerobolus stellatus (strain SS14) TaxID=990650 RepID=A0A0C9V1M4_SPHS4|nr:hypothetical protein M422DRAFT_36218 [Sphaerobolus stellatus SS14]